MHTKAIQCTENAEYRYTWPGKDETYACTRHARGIQTVGAAIGLHLQVIELSDKDKLELKCTSFDG